MPSSQRGGAVFFLSKEWGKKLLVYCGLLALLQRGGADLSMEWGKKGSMYSLQKGANHAWRLSMEEDQNFPKWHAKVACLLNGWNFLFSFSHVNKSIMGRNVHLGKESGILLRGESGRHTSFPLTQIICLSLSLLKNHFTWGFISPPQKDMMGKLALKPTGHGEIFQKFMHKKISPFFLITLRGPKWKWEREIHLAFNEGVHKKGKLIKGEIKGLLFPLRCLSYLIVWMHNHVLGWEED